MAISALNPLKLLCLRFESSAKECFGSLKPGPANELNVDVTCRVERRSFSFVNEECIVRNASGKQLNAQGLQWLIAFSFVICRQSFNEPTVRRDGNETEASKQLIFIHAESLTSLLRGHQG